MLVKELIDHLKECNQESTVLLDGGGWTYDTVYSITPVSVRKRVNVYDEEEIVDDPNPVNALNPNGVFIGTC